MFVELFSMYAILLFIYNMILNILIIL
jgi:hypothetical protein